MSVAELLVRAEVTADEMDVPGMVRVGGPVSPEQIWLVYRTEERFQDVDGQFDVGLGITACASRQVLEAVAEGRLSASLRGLAGYAGWAPGQLENEIRSGAWLPTDVDASIVFDVPSGDLWHKAYERIGTTPMAFTSRTVGSA
jgi:putative transcriptional regulator